MIPRYRFYREHKYICHKLFELDQIIAKADFRVASQVESIRDQLSSLEALLSAHAEWEETSIHILLKTKHSSVHLPIEAAHHEHAEQFKELYRLLEQSPSTEGYAFYLAYRKFVEINLKHLHDEETIIMPALQKLYSDEELSAVEAATYRRMTPEDMAHMTAELFPHLNPSDQAFFLAEMQKAEPEKFAIAKS